MRFLVLALVVATTLAGCSEAPATEPESPLDVTATTGCIRGIVVDEKIVPVSDARITIVNEDREVISDAEGSFVLCDLAPGSYFLIAERPLYETVQTSWNVEADVADPPVLKIQMQRIPGADAYLQTAQFDGFYSCAFALFFITDSCDFVIRTAHDAGASPVPRNVGNNHNTQFLAFSTDVRTIVQETWWNEDATRTFRSSLQETPIDNFCDCSTKLMERKGEGGYIVDRMDEGNPVDKNTGGKQSWPKMENLENGEVAIRGFIPFQEGASDFDYAVNLDFQIFTTFFFHYQPPEGWNLEDQDQYPVPE